MGDNEVIAAGNPDNGAKIFKQRCAQCHTTESVREGVCGCVPRVFVYRGFPYEMLILPLSC